MEVDRRKSCCLSDRAKCLIVGYLNLISSIVDIVCHLMVVFVASGGFQCDPDPRLLTAGGWMLPVMLLVNLGTHGLYPYPMLLSSYTSGYVDYPSSTTVIKCYPGMIHIQSVDATYIFFNMIWLNFVNSFVKAVHKRNVNEMQCFFGLSSIKLLLHLAYSMFGPNYHAGALPSYLQILDTAVAVFFLMKIYNYIKILKAEKVNKDQPPSYIESLISEQKLQTKEKSEAFFLQPGEDLKKENAPAILPI